MEALSVLGKEVRQHDANRAALFLWKSVKLIKKAKNIDILEYFVL